MKHFKYILIIGFFLSCEKHEFSADTKTVYPYEPFQDVVLDVKVVPVGDVELFFDDMNLEVNADYFNRYGIGLNLILQDRKPYNDGKISKETNYGEITVYVVPQEYIKLDGVAAYTARITTSQGTYADVILGEGSQTNRTLAHEMGHALGLGHINEKNNVMKLGYPAYQYDVPNDFNEKQIDTIISNLHWYD